MSHEQSHRMREQDLSVSRVIWLIEEGEPTRRATDTIQAPKERAQFLTVFYVQLHVFYQ